MVTRERSATDRYREGRHWAKLGVWEAAIEHGEQALALAPDDPEVLFLLGEACEQEGRLLRAKNYLQRLEATRPGWNDGAAVRALDRVRKKIEGQESSLANLRGVLLRVDKFCAEAFFGIACKLQRLGELEEARANLIDAEGFGWDPLDCRLTRGWLDLERGDAESARDCFAEALRLDEKLAYAWYGQATALWRLGLQREALRSVDRAFGLGPSNSCRWLRLQILEALGGDEAVPEPS